MSIAEDIKFQFRARNVLLQLIIVNVALFLLINLFAFILYVTGYSPEMLWKKVLGDLVEWLAVPYDPNELLYKPWTIITHFFLHVQLGHVFWNMVMLYFFGRVFTEYAGNQRILAVYCLGALTGIALSYAAHHLIPNLKVFDKADYALGASAGVMAVVVAAATLVPNLMVSLLFIGNVALKYVAIVLVVIDLISLPYYSNSGGHFAHLGGALFGFVFMTRFKAGKDWSRGFNRIFGFIRSPFSRKSRMAVVHKRSKSKTDEDFVMEKNRLRQRVDEILDKISRSGYESLTKEEKEILFKSSDKI